MFFVSKKKYNAMVAERDKWDGIASEAVAQNGRLLEQLDAAIKEMKNIQELNHRIVTHNDELVAHLREIEQELDRTRTDRNDWIREFDELDHAYGELEIQKDRFAEERDFYADRATYLEGEVEDMEELKAKLDFVIKQRDYYYDLLESTSEVEEKDE